MTIDQTDSVPAAVRIRVLIHRDWNAALTLAELAVLSFIYERTYPYGKDAERIPMRHFTDGVFAKTGELLHAPVHTSRATIVRALGTLRKKGVLVTSGKGWETVIYSINPAWSPMLTVSKDRALTEQGPCSHRANARAHGEHSITRDTNLGKEQGIITAGSDAPATLLDKLKATVERTDARRQRRISKGGVDAWETTWKDAWRNFHPEWPKPAAWTHIDKSSLKKSFARFPDFDPVDFLTWCIREWKTVHNRVRGLSASGALPMLRPFVRMIEPIRDLYLNFKKDIVFEGVTITEPEKVIEKLRAEKQQLQATVKRLAAAPKPPPAPNPRPYVPPGKQSMRELSSPSKPLTTRTGNPDWDKPIPKVRVGRIER